MSAPIEYRRQAYRSSSAYRDRICVRPGRIEYRMSDERAHMLLQELDEALHPWGEPGVVPMDSGGRVFVDWNGKAVPALLDGARFRLIGDDRETRMPCKDYRFRRRWAPEVPRG